MIPASRSLVLARRAGVLARGAQRRNMGGHSGEGHHSHDVFDMSTPFNPYRGPLYAFAFVFGGGLAVSTFAYKWGMKGWQRPESASL